MSTTHQPFIKWYPTDWRADPRLRMCSLAARGLWIELIGYMHEGEPYGHLTINGAEPTLQDIAALVGRPLGEVRKAMAELEQRQVYSTDAEQGTPYSRRMVRDKAKAEKAKEDGKNGGHPDIRRGTVPKEERVRRFRKSDAPEKAKRIFNRSAGACHWCRKKLDEATYHLDHVIAVRDGGTNDEANLVAACPDCNGERAMTWGRSDAELRVGIISDHNPQRPEARDQNPERENTADAVPAKYTFVDGVIRLNQRDFDNWAQAFSYLDLRAELLSLSKWTAEQGDKWFHALKGALAKRNRDVKAEKERLKEQGGFKWNGNIEGVI